MCLELVYFWLTFYKNFLFLSFFSALWIHKKSISLLRKMFSYSVILLSMFPGFLTLPGDRFCNQTYSTRFQTECTPCPQNLYVECPGGTEKVSAGRGYKDCFYMLNMGNETDNRAPVRIRGCRHYCRKTIVDVQCCDGYWGPDCNGMVIYTYLCQWNVNKLTLDSSITVQNNSVKVNYS